MPARRAGSAHHDLTSAVLLAHPTTAEAVTESESNSTLLSEPLQGQHLLLAFWPAGNLEMSADGLANEALIMETWVLIKFCAACVCGHQCILLGFSDLSIIYQKL